MKNVGEEVGEQMENQRREMTSPGVLFSSVASFFVRVTCSNEPKRAAVGSTRQYFLRLGGTHNSRLSKCAENELTAPDTMPHKDKRPKCSSGPSVSR